MNQAAKQGFVYKSHNEIMLIEQLLNRVDIDIVQLFVVPGNL